MSVVLFANHLVVVGEDGKLPLAPLCDEWKATWVRWPELRPLLRRPPAWNTPPRPPRPSPTGKSDGTPPSWFHEHEAVGDRVWRDELGTPVIAVSMDDEGIPVIAGWSIA